MFSPNSRLKRRAVLAAKGAAIGGTMLIPGVSGGTMAMMLGIYDRLIRALSGFRRHSRASLITILCFCLGAGAGMLLLSKPLLHLLQAYPRPVSCFFIGAVAGSIPMVWNKARMGGFHWQAPVCLLGGMAAVLLLERLPAIHAAAAAGAQWFVWLLIAGVVSAVALVLPGISVSYLLLLLGMYDKTILAIHALDLGYLIPLGLGLVLGVVLTTKALDRLMTRHPRGTYLTILGFMLATLPTLFPGWPVGWEWVVCLPALLAGFALIAYVSRI